MNSLSPLPMGRTPERLYLARIGFPIEETLAVLERYRDHVTESLGAGCGVCKLDSHFAPEHVKAIDELINGLRTPMTLLDGRQMVPIFCEHRTVPTRMLHFWLHFHGEETVGYSKVDFERWTHGMLQCPDCEYTRSARNTPRAA